MTHLHQPCVLMHMRTTRNIDDKMLRDAMKMTGIKDSAMLNDARLWTLDRRLQSVARRSRSCVNMTFCF
jgi:hypothetical protein